MMHAIDGNTIFDSLVLVGNGVEQGKFVLQRIYVGTDIGYAGELLLVEVSTGVCVPLSQVKTLRLEPRKTEGL